MFRSRVFRVIVKKVFEMFTIGLTQCAIIPPRSEKMPVMVGFTRLVVTTVTLGAKLINITSVA